MKSLVIYAGLFYFIQHKQHFKPIYLMFYNILHMLCR